MMKEFSLANKAKKPFTGGRVADIVFGARRLEGIDQPKPMPQVQKPLILQGVATGIWQMSDFTYFTPKPPKAHAVEHQRRLSLLWCNCAKILVD